MFRWACLLTPVVVVLGLLTQIAPAGAQSVAPTAPAGARAAAATPSPDQLAAPGRFLRPGWKTSRDQAVTVAGDATGLHVLAASEASGYQWRTVATLTAPGTDTAQWIGQACVTGDGQHAVVVYAPAQLTNSQDALDRGALAAVVDLASGTVTPVGAGVSIAYFDPGCGTGQSAVLTQGGWGTSADVGAANVTRLMMLDAATGRITSTVTLPGEVASAVPYRGNIAAVYGPGVVSIDPQGRVTTLARTAGTTFRLTPDAAGGLGYQVMSGRKVQLRRYADSGDHLVATVTSGSVDLSQIGGHVFAAGPAANTLGGLPADWQAVKAPAMAQVSTTGALAVVASAGAGPARGQRVQAVPGTTSSQAQPVRVAGWAPASGQSVVFTVPATRQRPFDRLPAPLPGFPAAGAVKAGGVPAASPSAGASARAVPAVSPPPATANPATTTYDPDRTCSVPRNDPKTETYQPDDQQIEWATDEAVRGDLTDTRGPDLYGSGLPSYTPQGMFPLPGLDGGGSVPPQIMLGIETQESDLYQASDHVIIGEAGNFEPSYSWYGDKGDYTYVNWAASDCGYGIAQVTSGMCLAGASGCSGAFPYQNQLAVAVDYQANIAAGLQILEQKWNQLYSDSITANGGNSQYIEDWYFALWDYNSGLEPDAANGNTSGCTPSQSCVDSHGDWGLGWANNPANDAYPPDRPSFLNSSTAEAPANGSYLASWEMTHPQYWPYQEKVIGWAFDAFSNWSFLSQAYVQAYAWGSWASGVKAPAIAPYTEFCTSADYCTPGDVTSGTVADTADPCQLTGTISDHCWWHWPASWATCSAACGTGVFTYSATAGDPGDPGVPSGYPPVCTASPLPSSAVIVGDTPSSIPAPLGCGESWSNNGGTMTWQFGDTVGKNSTTYPSKIDFHQIAAGYGGHFWFTHTMSPAGPITSGSSCIVPSNPELEVTGTWTPPTTVHGWTKIWVALPNVGAQAPDAMYQITTATGQAKQLEVLNQHEGVDSWEYLGDFNLGAGANVALNNVSCDGAADNDIAWDAMAFVPSSPLATNYVAMGDSYSSGEGVSPFYPDSDNSSDSCHRSTAGYPTLVKLPGQSSTIATQAASQSSNVSFSYIACSGAETTGITEAAVDNPPTADDQAGHTDWGQVQPDLDEGLQADDQGRLNSATTLVTLTIGGNDARFSDVLSGCIKTVTDCISSGYKLTRASNGVVDPAVLTSYEQTVIGLVTSHLEATYKQIHTLAPNAEIIVLGYPLLFPQGATSSCKIGSVAGVPVTMNSQDQNWLNQMGSLLNSNIATAVSWAKTYDGADIHYVNPTSAFTGHDVCSSSSWILPLSSFVVTGSGFSLVNTGSFHPNQTGQAEYADLVNGCLAGTVSC
jgi:hypothetical protein